MYRVKVPATSANLGPGFDVLGMALSQYSIFECELKDEIIIEVEGLDKDKISLENNLVIKSMNRLFDYIGKYPKGYYIKINNKIPLARGLGSSASAVVGGLMCANYLMDKPLNREELLMLASEIEGHPDNVAPALIGGIVLSAKKDNGEIIHRSIIPFDDLTCLLFIPEYEILTKDSRDILPKTFSIEDTTHNSAYLSLMVMGFINGDKDLIGETMKDLVHEPYRKKLVRGFDDLKKVAIDGGAFSFSLSGAGPTVIAYSTEDKSYYVKKGMEEVAEKLNIKGQVKILKACKEGAIEEIV